MKTTSTNRVNEWKTAAVNGREYRVHKYAVLTTQYIVISVYEARGLQTHGAIMHHDGERLGEVASRRLPEAIDALRGEARYAACDAFRAANLLETYAAIEAVYPGDFARGVKSGNDVLITVERAP